MHQKPAVLLCTNHMARWAGSELVILELAEEFRRRHHLVTVFANEVSGELREALQLCSASIAESTKQVDIFDFDIVYAQHHVLPLLIDCKKEVWTQRRKRFPVFIFNHLSPYNPFETPGPFVESAMADFIFGNSPETAERVRLFGVAFEKIEVFANPAPMSFQSEHGPSNKQLERLLVVSNHLPEELDAALKMVKNKGVQVTRIGRHDTPKRVTPRLLRDHDAVVTIGKTAQYAVRSKRPVFCYDRFAGPGWIDSAIGYADAKNFNFSGRNSIGKRDAETLAEEIVAGFQSARSFFIDMGRDEIADICLESKVDVLLERIEELWKDSERDAARWDMLGSAEMQQKISQEAAYASIIRNEYRRRRSFERKTLRSRIQKLRDSIWIQSA